MFFTVLREELLGDSVAERRLSLSFWDRYPQ